VKRFPQHAEFTAVPAFFPNQPCYITNNIHIPEGTDSIYDYHYYQMMLQVNKFLYKLGVVQSVDRTFLSRPPAKQWLHGYMTSKKMFYNPRNKTLTKMSKQGPDQYTFIESVHTPSTTEVPKICQ
jgi:hypothetical protein